MSAGSVAVTHGVACGVSAGRASDFLRVVESGARRIVAMADGYTPGWDCGETSLSVPMLDAIERAVAAGPVSPYRDASGSRERLFEAGRASFLTTTREQRERDELGGPGAQLTILELDGSFLRATWLARMELCVFRGAVVQRITRTEPSPSIGGEGDVPSTIELGVSRGDVVTLSSRRWVGHALEHARSELLARLADGATSPERLVRAMLDQWAQEGHGARTPEAPSDELRLILAAARID